MSATTTPWRVFISSTYEDMKEYREAARQALANNEQIPVGMEQFVSAPETSLAVCLQEVRRCNLFICLVAMRYGSVAEETGKSYSELEYEEAVKNNIPVLAFVINENECPILPKYVDTGESAEKLVAFKKRLNGNRMTSRFSSAAELKDLISRSVKAQVEKSIAEERGPRIVPNEAPDRGQVQTQSHQPAEEKTKQGGKAKVSKKLIAIISGIAGLMIIGVIAAVLLTSKPPPPPPPPNPAVHNIAAAGNHTLALKKDGTILSTGWAGRPVYLTSKQIVHYGQLSNVKKIVGNNNTLAVLHSNGEISTTFDTNDLNKFQGVTDVAVGSSHLIALKSDGTVISAGYDSYGETDVGGWRDIVAVYAGRDWSVGLKSDGTVVATGRNTNGQCDVSQWTDVVSIITGYDYTLGIKSDGSILGKGSSSWTGSSSVDLTDFKDCKQLAGSDNHLVGLKSDGTVIASGSNYRGQCDVYGWKDIVKVSASGNFTVGLKSDGTMLFTGRHDYAQYDPNQFASDTVDVLATDNFIAWLEQDGTIGVTGNGYFFDLRMFPQLKDVKNVSAIAAGDNFAAVLTAEGKVITWGDNSAGQWAADDWTSITAIAAGANFLLGLQSDGKVVSTYTEKYDPIDVSTWSDIIEITAGRDFAVGLKKDGTVVASGNNDKNQLNVRDWSDIIAISAGRAFTVGLKANGTCVATGNNGSNESNVFDWTEITRIASDNYLTIGLRSNGSVVITGDMGYGNNKINVSLWSDIVDVAVGAEHAIGLKSDGTLVGSGANAFGQIDLNDWALW